MIVLLENLGSTTPVKAFYEISEADQKMFYQES